MSDSGVRAVILAGGKGTRLMPLTENLPKPLVPVGGLPILEIIVRQLRQFGIDDLTLSVGHLHGLLESHFGDGSDGAWRSTTATRPTRSAPPGRSRWSSACPTRSWS
jgi:NDP-sugar pyrophosphorylase family protein